ncbi:MAG: hypothetical protein A3B77_01520, partial [Candidatus Doudnabacteria bacterium RIFCSPHIGHO2_02_FULL_49_24]
MKNSNGISNGVNKGFWDQLNKPIFALAPMADVTDLAFRTIIAKYGKPPVMWTEFVSVDGLLSPGKPKLLVDLQYTEAERPIVAQIFGAKPENFYQVAQMLKAMRFDGIDINMGCPVKKVLNQASCSALIKTPALAQEIILAAREGGGGLPVSVKTRIGFKTNEIETWIPQILATKPAALIVHLRTVKEMSRVPAHWELVPEIMRIRNQESGIKGPLILGNGDVMSLAEAEQKVKDTGCDGVMLGRGIFGNPWLFSRHQPSTEEKLRVMIEHTYLFEQTFAGVKSFDVMKKHYKAYVAGFDGAKEIRTELMEQAKTAADVERI